MDASVIGCRCCLTNIHPGMRKLEEVAEGAVKYIEMLEYLTEPVGCLSIAHYICDMCEIQLMEAYSFKKKCSESQRILFVIKNESENNLPKINLEEDFENLNKLNMNIDEYTENDAMKSPYNSLMLPYLPWDKLDELIGMNIEIGADEIVGDTIENENTVANETTLEDIIKKEDIVKEASPESLFVCSLCNLDFISLTQLSKHYKLFHNTKSSKELPSESHYNINDKKEDVVNKLEKCSKCDLVFISKSSYLKHFEIVHKSESQFKCAKPNSTTNRSATKRIKRIKIACSKCGKLVAANNMKSHQDSHNSERKYKCHKCDKSFQIRNSLTKHKRVHENDLRYECSFCEKKFLHWNSRKIHVVTCHTKEKNYVCKFCDKKFTYKSNLVSHIRVHTGEKPYKCKECDVSFSSINTLQTHIGVHTKERNVICQLCGKGFKIAAHLARHMRLHKKKFICQICSEEFKNNKELRKHLTTHNDRAISPPLNTLTRKRRIPVRYIPNTH